MGKKRDNTRSAIEQAQSPQDGGALSNAATRMFENLLDVGIDGKGPFDSARSVADKALAAAGGDPERAVTQIVNSHLKWAAGAGFVTSLGGFFTMPISLPANVIEFYLLATRMTAAVAHLRGHNIDQREIRTAILLTLIDTEADDLLAKAGVVSTGKLASLATRELPGPALMVVNKAVGFRLLTTAGTKTFAKLGKGVPIVGGAIGAGLDTYLMRKIAANAREEFPRNLGNPPEPALVSS